MPSPKATNDLAIEAIDDAYKTGVDRLFGVAVSAVLADKSDADGSTTRFRAGLAILNETRQRLIDAVSGS